MREKLAAEIMDAANGTGRAVKRRKIHTGWQKPIRLLRTIDDQIIMQISNEVLAKVPILSFDFFMINSEGKCQGCIH